jgi:putative transposase
MTRPREGAADGADSVAWGQSLADCDFSRAITTESNPVCSLIARYVLYCNVTRRALVQIAGAGKGTVLISCVVWAQWEERSYPMARRKDPKIPDAILDQLLGGADPKTAFDPNRLLDDLKKALAERALNAEIDHHLANGEAGNSRNGYGKKTVITDTARIELDVPRDRQSTFDPHLIAKYQRRFPGFDEKIISMYARGMSVREIVGHLRDLYGVEVSPDLISAVTDAVLDEVAAWQGRPLEPVYPLVFFDALRIKIRDEGLVRNKAVYVALGVRADGTKEILGLWLEQNEGAKFWLRVMNELKTRA